MNTELSSLDKALANLDVNEWQISAIQQALDRADSPQATYADHEDVTNTSLLSSLIPV